MENIDLAEKLYKNIIDKNPYHIASLIGYAKVADIKKEEVVAFDRWTKVISTAPNNIQGICGYAKSLFNLGNKNEAKKYIIDKINLYPNNTQLKNVYADFVGDNFDLSDNIAFNAKPFFIKKHYDFSNENIIKKLILKTFWWDGKPNFGDWIGPLLIQKLFNITCANMINQEANHIVYTVGSIIQALNHQNHHNIKIWGSGLMRPLIAENNSALLKKIRSSDILALRGKHTFQELSQHMDLDKNYIAFGDPALLLPNIYFPKYLKLNQKDICIVPHFMHKFYFFSRVDLMDNFHIVNVQSEPITVINQIISSKICISSSLHGIIIAQAYGIPWVWLKIEDNLLTSDEYQDFKFFDFFSVMNNPDHFTQLSIYSQDISVTSLNTISQQAKLMDMPKNFDKLTENFRDFIYD